MIAYDALLAIAKPAGSAPRTVLDAHVDNLGYALLLKQFRPDIENATEAKSRWPPPAPSRMCRCSSGRFG